MPYSYYLTIERLLPAGAASWDASSGRWEIGGVTRAQFGPHLAPVGSATGVTRRADYGGGPARQIQGGLKLQF